MATPPTLAVVAVVGIVWVVVPLMVVMSPMAQQPSCWLSLKVLTLGPHLRRKKNKAEEDEDAHAENTVGSQLHRACLEAGRVGYVGYSSTALSRVGVLSLSRVGVRRQGLFVF